MFAQLRAALIVFVLLTAITGVLYPLAVTAVAKAFFNKQAEGSLIIDNGQVVGSKLIGQTFDDPKYFWGRPSATSPVGYNAAASTGSNLGPTNPALLDAVKVRVGNLQAADPENKAPVPVDLVTASASGLDPHISPAAAEYQINRVAKLRRAEADTIRRMVAKHTEGRTFGVLGEPRVNVLLLNRDLEASFPTTR